MAARRAANGKFAKKEATEAVAPGKSKFTLSDRFHRVEPKEIETDFTGSDLDAFKIRERNIFAGNFGFDPDNVRID